MHEDPKFRPNVGIVLADGRGQLLVACRPPKRGQKDLHWQFPQGGIENSEEPTETLFRELHEELGLTAQGVRVLSQTSDWLRYSLPHSLRNRNKSSRGKYSADIVGQKQKWFLLEMLAPESAINLNTSQPAEFFAWRWVSYWYPLHKVVFFKRAVYREVLRQFSTTHNELVRRNTQTTRC